MEISNISNDTVEFTIYYLSKPLGENTEYQKTSKFTIKKENNEWKIDYFDLIYGIIINNTQISTNNSSNTSQEKEKIKNISKIDVSGEEISKEDIENIYNNVAYSTVIMCNYPNSFIVSNSSDEEKLQIVFDSIGDFKRINEQLYNKISPKSITIDKLKYELKINNLYIERNIIENKFYEIFGNNYKFRTDVQISLCGEKYSKFIYNKSLDIFVYYDYNGGSACSCAWGGSEIYKAYKKDNKLKIYTITSGKEEIDAVYTFNLEKGKYVFESFEYIN